MNALESHCDETIKVTSPDEVKSLLSRNVQYTVPIAAVVMLLSCVLLLTSCLHRNTEKLFREVEMEVVASNRQLGTVGLSCNSGQTLIGSKCYLACDNGYSVDSTGTICVKNCASGETSTATTCTQPRIDDLQSDCCTGSFMPCPSIDGRSFFCYDGGYPFPISQCHCRSDAVTYRRATTNRIWQCPIGTTTGLDSCTPTSAPITRPSSKPVTPVSSNPPTKVPSRPTIASTKAPSKKPSSKPTTKVSSRPTIASTKAPSTKPSSKPTTTKSSNPPVTKVSSRPTTKPSLSAPSKKPSAKPTTRAPTFRAVAAGGLQI
eukprot:gene29080-38138_t